MSNILIGCDVSSSNGVISWDLVKKSNLVNFIFTKATEGVTYVDPQFKSNWDTIKQHDFVRGCYHFCRTNNDPIKEADHFVDTIGELDPEDMLAIDLEVSNIKGQQFVDWLIACSDRIKEQTSKIPILYTGVFIDAHLGKPTVEEIEKITSMKLWLAAYVNDPTRFVPSIYKKLGYILHQVSGDVAPQGCLTLRISGIKGNVDKDRFVGSLDDLKSFAQSLNIIE